MKGAGGAGQAGGRTSHACLDPPECGGGDSDSDDE